MKIDGFVIIHQKNHIITSSYIPNLQNESINYSKCNATPQYILNNYFDKLFTFLNTFYENN